jgi:hypothetical protein
LCKVLTARKDGYLVRWRNGRRTQSMWGKDNHIGCRLKVVRPESLNF